MPIPKRAHKRRSAQELALVRQRVVRIFDEAELLFRKGEKALSRRRVRAARRAAMKVQLRIPEHADRYCRKCSSYLIIGENATVRVKDGIRIRVCKECGAVRRKVLRSA